MAVATVSQQNTRESVEILEGVFRAFSSDPDRSVIRHRFMAIIRSDVYLTDADKDRLVKPAALAINELNRGLVKPDAAAQMWLNRTFDKNRVENALAMG